MNPAPLPYSAPAWLTPRRVVFAAVVLFALAAALPSVWWINEARHEIGPGRRAQAAMACSTALLSLVVVWGALRARKPGGTALWCLIGGPIAGVLNAGLSLAGVTLVVHGDPGRAVAGFVMGCFFGSFYGGPLGFVYGGAYLLVVRRALQVLRSPSHDGIDRVLGAVGVWLVATAAVVQVLATPSPAVISPAALAAVGLTVAAFAGARMVARQRWLARVAEGRAPGWEIAARVDGREERGLLPVVRAGELELPEGVLLRVGPPGDPYRHAPAVTPVALVPLYRQAAPIPGAVAGS